jgi:hypothetical protein
MAKLMCMLWQRILRTHHHLQKDLRMTELSPEARSFYFALNGTSKEDRAWMQIQK